MRVPCVDDSAEELAVCRGGGWINRQRVITGAICVQLGDLVSKIAVNRYFEAVLCDKAVQEPGIVGELCGGAELVQQGSVECAVKDEMGGWVEGGAV